MRTLLLLFFVSGSISTPSFSQNLVPNQSFEDLIQCPFTVGQLDFANDWFIAGGTPDLFSSCNSSSLLGVPSNARGHQDALHGQNYGFVGNYSLINVNYRETIGVLLNQPLITGQKYYYSFFVSLADTLIMSCATNNFGIKFSTVNFDFANPIPIDNNPYGFYSSIVSNQDIWTVIRGSIVSDSAYLFLYLGNFFDDVNTDTLNCGPSTFYSGYYIDQICLSPDSLECELYTNISNSLTSNNFSLNSNIVSNHIILNFHTKLSENYLYDIFDTSGRVVKRGTIQSQPVVEIPFDIFSSGIYFIIIRYQREIFTFKIIKP